MKFAVLTACNSNPAIIDPEAPRAIDVPFIVIAPEPVNLALATVPVRLPAGIPPVPVISFPPRSRSPAKVGEASPETLVNPDEILIHAEPL